MKNITPSLKYIALSLAALTPTVASATAQASDDSDSFAIVESGASGAIQLDGQNCSAHPGGSAQRAPGRPGRAGGHEANCGEGTCSASNSGARRRDRAPNGGQNAPAPTPTPAPGTPPQHG